MDIAAAARFMTGHARPLDRRRFDLLTGDGTPAPVLAALDAYRNPDGGYGWGLEPDLRAPGSQPIHALHVFEVLAECGPGEATANRAAGLCDYLAGVSFEEGGLPFVVPIDDPTACAPWFTGADPTTPSLHGTVAVLAAAWRVPGIASHPAVQRATRWALDALAAADRLAAYETMFGLRLLDALHDDATHADEAAALLARLTAAIPPSGALPVEGGLEGEALHPLDYAPHPGRPVRAHLSPEIVEADLDRIDGGQQEDGGWEVDFASFSPMAGLEWRGYTTLRAVTLLVDNGRRSS